MARKKSQEVQDPPLPASVPKFLEPDVSPADAHLSGLAQSFWAKSDSEDQSLWLSLPQHLMDACDMAGKLFDVYLSGHHRRLLASVWNGDQRAAKAMLTFLAGTHDVGKASLAFTCQHHALADFVRRHGLEVPAKRDVRERALLPHGFVSHFSLSDVLKDCGHVLEHVKQWVPIVGVHHGRYPTASALAQAREAYVGGDEAQQCDPRWHQVREELIRWMARRTGFPLDAQPGTALPELPIRVAAAYASAVVIADWLASNKDLCPLDPREPCPRCRSAEEQAERIRTAWTRARIPHPIRIPALSQADVVQRYRHRFNWGPQITPTRAQIRAVEIAEEQDPDLMIVEAPPGSGKTEIAMAVAEVLVRTRDLQGVMFALPTQATTDAMFARTTTWLTNLLGDRPQELGIHLAHGKNDLNDEFLEMLKSPSDRLEIHDEEDGTPGLVANDWMAKRWRATLSPVVIGTIDQVLLAALKSRHVLVRHLGLMGKVVILDEVHAADAYMSTYLEVALTWLGMYEVPVVLMSATLPAEQRGRLLAAYRRGRCGQFRDVRGDQQESRNSDRDLDGVGYPAITTFRAGAGIRSEIVDGGGVHEPKRIQALQCENEAALADFMADRLAGGGCGAVIRNTVRAAQRTYEAMVERFGAEAVTLTHSRFLACDRAQKDRAMLDLFGKGSKRRPHRHVVVATQVIEQSLDVDFDVMVTDPAPMDLVLQRIGRLHRHAGRERPHSVRHAQCHVLVRDQLAQPWQFDRGTVSVYGEHPALRTLGILCDRGELLLERPKDYAELTQLAYSAVQVGPEAWQSVMSAAQDKDEKETCRSRSKAQDGTLDSSQLLEWDGVDLVRSFRGEGLTGEEGTAKGAASARAAVRDGEDQIPVLVIPVDPSLGNVPVFHPWRDDPDDPRLLDVSTWPDTKTLKEVRTWSIMLPPWSFREGREDLEETIDAVVGALWDDEFTQNWAFLEHPVLRGELVLPMFKVDEHSDRLEATLRGRRLTYTNQRGMEVWKA